MKYITIIIEIIKAIWGFIHRPDPNKKERKKIIKKELPKALKDDDVTKRTSVFLKLRKLRKR
jgi:hypothetical protein